MDFLALFLNGKLKESGIEIVTEDPIRDWRRLTFHFDKVSVEEVLRFACLQSGLEFKVRENKVVLFEPQRPERLINAYGHRIWKALDLDAGVSCRRIIDGKVQKKSITLNKIQAANFIALLRDSRSYEFDRGPKACLPEPGFEFSVQSDKEKVKIKLCLECEMISAEGRRWVDTDPAGKPFRQLLQQLFPKLKLP